MKYYATYTQCVYYQILDWMKPELYIYTNCCDVMLCNIKGGGGGGVEVYYREKEQIN